VYGPAPIAGFDPGPVPAGFVRYMTPPLAGIAPGGDVLACQWLSDPLTADEDVLAVRGAQSKLGHHVVLYATMDAEAVGTTRPCTSADMAEMRFLGFVAGEAGPSSAGVLPDGVVVRVPAGMALLANVHFVNASRAPIDGQAAIDVRLADADPSRTTAGFFVNTTLKLDVKPMQRATSDVVCKAPRDLPMLLMANHMHGAGTSASTEVIHADGSSDALVVDPAWSTEQEFDPAWTRWPLASPFLIRAGETVHTRCTWENATGTELEFPDEMCAGLGFFLGDGSQVACVDGATTD
jgi:hypothetical protein